MDGDISGMLRQVMENPQFGQMVQAMKAQMGGDGDGSIDPAKVMEKMPELMAALGPVMGSLGQTGGKTEAGPTGGMADHDAQKSAGGEKRNGEGDREDEKAAEREDVRNGGDSSGQQSALGAMFFKPGSREKRNKLLSALKPYLSPARCALVDRAMSAMQLGELLGTVTPPHHDA